MHVRVWHLPKPMNLDNIHQFRLSHAPLFFRVQVVSCFNIILDRFLGQVRWLIPIKWIRFQTFANKKLLVDVETILAYWLKWKLKTYLRWSRKMKKMNQNSAQRNGKNPLPSENVTQIVQGLLKCGQFLQREMNQVCQRFGLKQQQLNALNEIVWKGPISQKELGKTLLFEKSNVSKIVKILLLC